MTIPEIKIEENEATLNQININLYKENLEVIAPHSISG